MREKEKRQGEKINCFTSGRVVYSDSHSCDILEARALLFLVFLQCVKWQIFSIMERLMHYIVDGKWGIPFTDEVVLARERAWRTRVLTPAEREVAERERSKSFGCFFFFFCFLFLLSKFLVFIRHDAANSDVQRRPRCIRDAPWSERARATGEPEFMPSMTITMCSICFPVPPREVPEKEKITLSQRFTGLNPQDIPYEIKTALY